MKHYQQYKLCYQNAHDDTAHDNTNLIGDMVTNNQTSMSTSLKKWIVTQRRKFRRFQKYGSGMNPERIDLLNQMQFDWNGPFSHQSNDDFGNKSSQQ